MEEVPKIINKYWQNIVSEITGRLCLSYVTCQQILMEDLNMLWISMKFVLIIFDCEGIVHW
jgi:hypothetical protein